METRRPDAAVRQTPPGTPAGRATASSASRSRPCPFPCPGSR